jgi:hypothetical protein
MATKLFLRGTQANGIGATYFDMVTTAGSGAATAVVDTTASGTEIQWTQTAGGSVIQWVSGRAPSGGFTLTTTDISIWAHESAAQANSGGRYRVFKRASNGVETELGGGPFNDGVEFGTSATEMTWVGNVTDTAFAEDDRILLKVYITNVGTMGGGRTCTLTYNAADAATGDSFLNIAETVTFKAEAQPLTPALFTNTQTFFGPTVTPGPVTLTPNLFTNAQSFPAATVSATYALTPALFTNSQTFYGPTVTQPSVNQELLPPLFTNTQTFHGPTVSTSYSLLAPLTTNGQTFFSAAITQSALLLPPLLTNDNSFFQPEVAFTVVLAKRHRRRRNKFRDYPDTWGVWR